MPEDGAAKDPSRHRHQQNHQKGLERNAEGSAEPDKLKRRYSEGLQVSVGENLGNTAPGDKKHQRSDDRLNAKAGDQPAIKPTEEPGNSDWHYKSQGHPDTERHRDPFAEENYRSQSAGNGH